MDSVWAVLLLFPACGISGTPVTQRPLALHPENPHYFLFRGKPTILITSGEHYGAVLNRDFEYVKYLDTLQVDGLNLTRTFSGAYVEPQGAFKIARNTLAPAPGQFLCPWARSDIRGKRTCRLQKPGDGAGPGLSAVVSEPKLMESAGAAARMERGMERTTPPSPGRIPMMVRQMRRRLSPASLRQRGDAAARKEVP